MKTCLSLIHSASRVAAEKYDGKREPGSEPSVLDLLETAQNREWFLWCSKEEIDARLRAYRKVPKHVSDLVSAHANYSRAMQACYRIGLEILGESSEEACHIRKEVARLGCSLTAVYYQVPSLKPLPLTEDVLKEREESSKRLTQITKVFSPSAQSVHITDQVKHLAKTEAEQLVPNYDPPLTRAKKRNLGTMSGFFNNTPNKKR